MLTKKASNLTFVNLYTKKGEDPVFFTSKKENGSWVRDQEFDSIKGVLREKAPLEFFTEEYKKQEVPKFRLYMTGEDADGNPMGCRIEGTFGSVARSMINALLSVENHLIQEVAIDLYEKDGYPKAFVYTPADRERIDWKFSVDELPKPKGVENSKGVVISREYDELNNFLAKAAYEKFGKPESKAKAEKGKNAEPKKGVKNPPKKKEEVEDDDLPF